MGLFDSLPDYGGAPQTPSNGSPLSIWLPEYKGGGAPAAGASGYAGNILPLSVDANGGISPAVPRVLSGLFDSAVSGATAPGDALSGKLQTPYTPGATSATATPDALRRATDFGTIFGMEPVGGAAYPDAPAGFSRDVTPTAPQLKSAAEAGYDAARASTATVPGNDIAAMARSVQGALNDQGFIPKRAPGTHALLDELASPPAETAYTTGGLGTYSGLSAARDDLSEMAGELGKNGRPTPNAKAATTAIQSLDQLINNTFPSVAEANANYAAAMRTNPITGDFTRGNTGFLERAQAQTDASHSGLNLDNNIRQRVKTFLQNPANLRGYSAEEEAALNAAVAGSKTQNVLRYGGNLLGGGGGLGGMITGMAAGHYLGDGELGAMFGMGLGRLMKGSENALAARSLNPVQQMILSRSPLAQQTQGLLSPDAFRNSAVLGTLLPGLLGYMSGQQKPSGLLGPQIPWAQQLYDAGGA